MHSPQAAAAAQRSPAGPCQLSPRRPALSPRPPGRRRTRSVSSQQRRITPSTPATPMPSTTSRVSRKGTSSGVLRKRPCGVGQSGGAQGRSGCEDGRREQGRLRSDAQAGAAPTRPRAADAHAAPHALPSHWPPRNAKPRSHSHRSPPTRYQHPPAQLGAKPSSRAYSNQIYQQRTAHLLKGDAQVDVHGVRGARVQQDVLPLHGAADQVGGWTQDACTPSDRPGKLSAAAHAGQAATLAARGPGPLPTHPSSPNASPAGGGRPGR